MLTRERDERFTLKYVVKNGFSCLKSNSAIAKNVDLRARRALHFKVLKVYKDQSMLCRKSVTCSAQLPV